MATFNRIQIDLPEGWQDGSVLQLTEPTAGNTIPATITLRRTPLEAGVDAPTLARTYEASLPAALPGCEILQSEVIEVDGRAVHRIEFRWPMGGSLFRRVQATLVNGRQSLVLVCTGADAGFTTYEPLFQRAISSLRVS